MGAEKCICCGEIIPEGRAVCKKCEYQTIKLGTILQSIEASPKEVERVYMTLIKNNGVTE